MPTVGKKIEQLRTLRGWTLKELSERSGVSLSHISAIETGTRPNPSLDKVLRISKALGISLAAFDDMTVSAAVGQNEAPSDFVQNAAHPPEQVPTKPFDPKVQDFLASEEAIPYVHLAMRLAEHGEQYSASQLLQDLAEFIQHRKSP